MRKCLKVLNLLIERKVAQVKGDKLKIWQYQEMIKHHVEKCPDCRKFLEGIMEKSEEEKRKEEYPNLMKVLLKKKSCAGLSSSRKIKSIKRRVK